nr:hypothetical protein [Tanacetum cinerariifolium]
MARDAQRMNEQIARDAEIARIHAEEELQMLIDGLDRNNETVAKYLQEYDQFAAEFPFERRIDLISDLAKHFKGMALEEIKQNFDPVWKQIQDFIPLGLKEEAERFKRKGFRLEQESVKKLKTSEEVKETKEVPEDKVKEMMQLVPVEEVYVEALQVKHLIIDWKEEINSIRIDQHHFNAESDLITSLLNRDSSIIPSSLTINSLLDEFAGELTLLKSIPPGIDDTDCHPENEIRLIERLLYDNSSPHLPKEIVSENSNAEIKSFSPSPIPIKDSDSFLEEINLTFTSDDPMPSSIEDDDDDSEGDNLFLERLLHDNPIPLLDTLDFSYDVRVFLPFFTYPVTSSILLSSGSEDTIFDPGIHHFSSLKPGVSHWSGTFIKFNESLMEMVFSTCSPMDQ